MDDFKRAKLGRTGLPVCRLGVACSYGAPTEAFEEAFDHGVNYFWWGSRRTAAMQRAIRHILGRGKRDELVIVIQSYSRSAALMERFYQRALKQLGIDSADILLLGWHNSMPSRRIFDRALQMKDKGFFRFLGLSGHNRSLFPQLAATLDFDLFHIRYNAAHRGAEQDIFTKLDPRRRPGLVSYTATRWGDLLKRKRMPPDRQPLTAADCYRFVLSNPAVDVCMTGPRTAEQMKEALKALSLGPLSEEEMARVRQIGDFVHATSRRLSFG
jgi:aryl-alcohol dehydrogenase-like predicted oxidoreductase